MSEHIYYKLRFELLSPMCIGTAVSAETDKDVMLGADGKPFIPATTIAGKLAGLCPDQPTREKLFGSLESGDSPVMLYDALMEGKWDPREHLGERDLVALNRYRVADEHLKFDMQCVQPGCVFTGFLELKKENGGLADEVEALLSRLRRQECGFGGKSNRGFGRASVTVWKKTFDLSSAEQRKEWLSFDPFTGAFPEEVLNLPCPDSETEIRMTLRLRLKDALSVRVYNTEVAADPNGTAPDTLPFRVNGKAAVPGTSWAGAFSHRFGELGGEELRKKVFGYVEKRDGKTEACASRITFSETVLEGGADLQYTRNAVDRFSGKVQDGALFTELVHYGGTGTLTITLREGEDAEHTKQVLAACVADLAHGFLSVGGLGSVGRGIFEVTGIDCTDENLKKQMISWMKSDENGKDGCA